MDPRPVDDPSMNSWVGFAGSPELMLVRLSSTMLVMGWLANQKWKWSRSPVSD
jgi:hypothetical protein